LQIAIATRMDERHSIGLVARIFHSRSAAGPLVCTLPRCCMLLSRSFVFSVVGRDRPGELGEDA
jgi:hypothetical protein